MKQIVKMSLAAALVVSTMNAGSLEEAIKGVDISGHVAVGYNYGETQTPGTVKVSTNQAEYDLYVKVVVPVNDNVKVTASIENDPETQIGTEATSNDDANELKVKEIYFTYANGPVTVMAGKQGVSTPWTSSVRGDGVVAMYNVGPVTLAAANFEGNTLSVGDTLSAAAVIGSFGGVNASLWALQTSLGDGYSVNVNGKIAGMVSYDVRHTTFELDSVAGVAQDEFELSKIVLGANLGPVALTLGYGVTNDANNGVSRGAGAAQGVAVSKDNGEAADLYMDVASLDDYNDAQAFVIGASIPVGAWTFGAVYLDAESDDVTGVATPTVTADVQELNVNVKYAMSSNFSITGLYTDFEIDATGTALDQTDERMELSLNYSF